nr:reverse transcriptase domain-containing protein [Tanacetum cinerariifolium]
MLSRFHVAIVCDEKLVQIPYGNETLTFCGNECNNGRESRLTVISGSKAQEYMAKGWQIFLTQISAKKEEDKSEGKQLKDVPVVRDYPEFFPKDLMSLPPARPVEFQIDLIPGATPVARAPYRLAPSEMKELEIRLSSAESARTRRSKNGIQNSNEKEHKEHLKVILEFIKKEELYAKFSKCEFWIPKVQFLGHVIDSRGIHVDQAKIESIKELSRVHHTFHVSNLKKCYADEPLVMSLEGIHVDDRLQFVEEPVEIMEREIKRLKRSRIPLVKVRWNSRRGPEFTWECEDLFRKKYPHLFTNRVTSSTARP